ncbi:MAG: tRNA (adenosine(37)-N6)-threonylcarbamoyltransferase complex transferase subunit TsaD [Candidatus Marsarchaeota archaeon]|jgi:glycoprotease/Kae1 family metallohydrolase|nr:tRNA (adenosine(37)-N6)-threonylcarbamoyltransferase complex transferase subunit TsaD [Candidatus Marsarchaeota archaeon]
MAIVIGIESSAHTFGVGIVKDGRILANEKIMYPINDTGIIPAKVADFHAINAQEVLKNALLKSNLTMKDIDAVGYTKGPGLGPCLRVGQLSAKTLSLKYNIPLFPINHALAHIEIVKQLNNIDDVLVLYVSGGNSQILALTSEPFKHYHVYGETLDISIGNMLDNFARYAKLKPAWGSSVAKAALNGSYLSMPYTVKGMDFTFTGLLTYAEKMLPLQSLNNVAYSLQETAFAMLCEAAERALLLLKKKSIIICGGVAQSSRLKEMITKMAEQHNASVYTAPNEFNADNGAMIAVVAEHMLKSNEHFDIDDCNINQKYRIDSAKIMW